MIRYYCFYKVVPLLFRQCDAVELGNVAWCVLAKENLFHLLHYIGILGCKVVVLVEVCHKVIELACSTLYDELPVTHTQSHHVGLVELPVEELMCLLLTLAKKCGSK